MRKMKLAAAVTALGLTGAAVTMGAVSAQAATTGKGTSLAKTTILGLQIGTNGSVLNLSVLGDNGQATIDAAQKASSDLTLVSASSQAIGLNQTIGSFDAHSPGGSPSTQAPATDLGTALPVAGIIAGSVSPGSLTAAVDLNGARSGLNTAVTNLAAAAGLAAIGNVGSTLGANAAPDSSTASRSIQATGITVLNIGDLLRGLGINPDQLSVSALSSLLQSLGVPVSGLPVGSTLDTVVSALVSTLNQLQATLTATTQNSQVQGALGTIDSILSGATGTLGTVTGVTLTPPPSTTSTVNDLTTAVNANISSLESTLVSLLTNGLSALNNVSLLSADGLNLGVGTKAADTVANSSATITATLGKITVAGLPVLPALDLTGPASTISGAVTSINNQLSTVLGTVAPGTDLNKLLTVSALQQTKNVDTSGAYTEASAGLTALSVTITPPADLASIVNTVTAATQTVNGQSVPNVASLLTSNGVAAANLPVVGAPMVALDNALNVAGGVLTQGAVLTVGSIQAASNYTVNPAAAPAPATPAAPDTNLPRTGGPTALLGALGAMLAAAALGLRRWQRRASTIKA